MGQKFLYEHRVSYPYGSQPYYDRPQLRPWSTVDPSIYHEMLLVIEVNLIGLFSYEYDRRQSLDAQQLVALLQEMDVGATKPYFKVLLYRYKDAIFEPQDGTDQDAFQYRSAELLDSDQRVRRGNITEE